MSVALLIPVLGRPHRVAPLLESIDAATPEAHRALFIANEGDDDEIAALSDADADFIVIEQRSYACKINAGYRATTEPWLFAGADDLAFRPDWFSRALEWQELNTEVIGTNDICNPRVMTGAHSTHTLFRRSYIATHSGVVDEPDTVMFEGYGHDWTDDEFIQTAMARGVYVHAFDSIVEHMHMLNGKAPDDETYRLGRVQSRNGKRLFLSRKRLWRNLQPL